MSRGKLRSRWSSNRGHSLKQRKLSYSRKAGPELSFTEAGLCEGRVVSAAETSLMILVDYILCNFTHLSSYPSSVNSVNTTFSDGYPEWLNLIGSSPRHQNSYPKMKKR
jgi:hypothetical protein